VVVVEIVVLGVSVALTVVDRKRRQWCDVGADGRISA
jgi:hypothetical protein